MSVHLLVTGAGACLHACATGAVLLCSPLDHDQHGDNPPRPARCRDAVREMFLPRRTAFAYEFEPEEDTGLDTDVPTTVRRSKADCPQVRCMPGPAVDAAAHHRGNALWSPRVPSQRLSIDLCLLALCGA